MKYPVLQHSLLLVILWSLSMNLSGQELPQKDTTIEYSLSTGWADEAVGIGYVTAPSVFVLTFISGVVSEWNSGYFGIPASVLILASPPIIFLGGRSVDISRDLFHPRAKLAWALYALSIIPTSFALYSYTTDWGASVPLMIASGVLGGASIIAMTTYAFARAKTATNMAKETPSVWNFGLAPLRGGALAMVTYRF
jgi:hypothetical protein